MALWLHCGGHLAGAGGGMPLGHARTQKSFVIISCDNDDRKKNHGHPRPLSLSFVVLGYPWSFRITHNGCHVYCAWQGIHGD